MNGFIHPGHLAAIQHFDRLRTPEQYETDRILQMADEERQAERKADRRIRRTRRRSERRRLTRLLTTSRRIILAAVDKNGIPADRCDHPASCERM